MARKPELEEGGPAVDYHSGEAPRPPVTSWQRGSRHTGLGDQLRPIPLPEPKFLKSKRKPVSIPAPSFMKGKSKAVPMPAPQLRQFRRGNPTLKKFR